MSGVIVGNAVWIDKQGSRDRLQVIPGWGLSVQEIKELKVLQVEIVRIRDTETKLVYEAPLVSFEINGIPVDYKTNVDRVLPDAFWAVSEPDKPVQLRLL